MPSPVIAACFKPIMSSLIELPDAMAQCRFWDVKRAAGRHKSTAVDDLHKIKEVVQVEHPDLHIVQSFGRCVPNLPTS
jgi:hypothetical protein